MGIEKRLIFDKRFGLFTFFAQQRQKFSSKSSHQVAVSARGQKQGQGFSMFKKRAIPALLHTTFFNIKKTKVHWAACIQKILEKMTHLSYLSLQQSENKPSSFPRPRTLLSWLANLLLVSIQLAKNRPFLRPEDKSFRNRVYGNGKNSHYSPTLGSRKLMAENLCTNALIARVLAASSKPHLKTKALGGISRYPALNKVVSLSNRYGFVPIYACFYRNRSISETKISLTNSPTSATPSRIPPGSTPPRPSPRPRRG